TVAALPTENTAQENSSQGNSSEDKNSQENTTQGNPTEGKTTDEKSTAENSLENLQPDDQERPQKKLILRILRINPKARRNPTEGKTTDEKSTAENSLENLQPDDQERPQKKLILRILRINPKARSGQKRVRMTTLESVVVTYVESYNPKGTEEGGMLIECDGNDANRKMCYSVVRPREYMHSKYVRAVANMYNREWALEYPKNSRRIILDSSVYVPVVDNGHWWCVVFALKDQKIWFIDSMFTNPASEHSGDVKKLIPAVEYVLHGRDTQYNAYVVWKLKQMHTWPLDSISFPDYNDNHACGIVMLMATRESARAFTTTMQVVNPLLL
ncbi:hypothetical protein SOVF_092580, partial [Spinacia oleracea]